MCQKCVRHAKNLGAPTSVRPGLIRVLTHQYEQGIPVPLFGERAANYAIEAGLYKIEQERTYRDRQLTRADLDYADQLDEIAKQL